MTPRTIYETPRPAPAPGETIYTSTCGHNCGGRCVVNAHVREGRIVKISTDPRKWTPELPPLHACVRGFGQGERVNHPDRLRQPLRRVGPRGSGQFEPIGWDEALDEVAAQLRRVRDTYGPAAILDCSRTGSLSLLHGRGPTQRMLHMLGGCTELWTNISAEAEVFAVRATYGAKAEYKSAGREPSDYVNSRLILMWGWSPADGTFGTGTHQYLKLARQRGVRIVCVDPRRTRTSHELADEHIFIRPSTDTAALVAMAYVIASEGLQDAPYLDRHVLGFDEAHLPPDAPAGSSYRAYLMGHVDGVRKTPEWAEAITGIPAATLHRLAVEFATTKPAAMQTGYAPGRTIHGEQFHRAAYALAAMTGNVGVPGGNSGTSNGSTGRGAFRLLPAGANPAKARVASSLMADLLERGRAGGYPADIKMIYSTAGDLFNQLPNINKMHAAAQKLEFMVVHEHFMTPTARWADIVLPATTFWERNDVHTPWAGAGHYAIFMQKAIEPIGECRNDLDICTEIARRLGVAGYNDKTEEAWLRELTSGVIDDFETFRASGLARLPAPEDTIAFAREIREPERHPFTTPSGKIEIYSMALAAEPDPYGLGVIPPIPTWIPDPQPATYPLRLISPKSRARTHSIHDNQPILSRADRDDVWINPGDAAARGIADGERVRVFNHRGATLLPARVTDRIAPGVVSIKEGAWYTPDALGQDTRGCANVLTDDRSSPAGATPFNTCFVDVARA
ncbi:MAG TPA: molybdopterin-dependent oxidoreductase [Methylomirabilota bacterium]|jgi:anaerobic dimethyl sulfoxide reductase subunit A|nr:molybdopterin-dependent oxidoreductase [Methylomirabilota bacterium]